MVYEFGGFQIDLFQRVLVHKGRPIALTRKVFDTLALLVQSGGRILKKEELMEALWPESFVEEGNLTQNIFVLRKILGDERNGSGFIETIPRQGYKFVASVRKAEASTFGSGLLADYWSSHSPFRSLRSFDTEDAWLFFGRESEVEDLLERLTRSPVLTIIGNSGSGKSSLLRAGLIPALRAGRARCETSRVDSWRIAVFRPSASPLDYLADVLPNQLAELDLKQRAEFVAECRDKFPAGGDTLRNAISALARRAGEEAGKTRVLLVADQFEEIFTLTTNNTNKDTRDRYIDLLLAAARPDSTVPVHLVLVLRADFYAHCLEHAGLSRCLESNLYNVPRMTRDALRETIEKRLQLATATAEPGLIDSLLEDVGAEPGNLALLEHALGQLWEKCGGYGCTLSNRAYAEIGRLRGALGRHADEVYAGLADEQEKLLARRIFLELVHLGEGSNVQDTRRRLPKSDLLALATADEVESLLGRLASSRLISTGREGGEVFVEVSHEALIREWPALREWLAENREELRLERRLQQAAEEWDGLNRDPGALLRGARLAQGEEWLARTPGAPTLVRAFLQASIAARDEAERKKAMQQRWFSRALASVLLVAIAVAWLAYHREVIQKSRAMAAQSGELLSRDRGQALDLAVRSWGIAKTQGTYLAVTKALPDPIGVFKHSGSVEAARFSPDGQRILTASWDHTAKIWNTADGRLLLTLQGHTDKIQDAVFSPDGRFIVTASWDHTARVWNSADGRLLAILKGHADQVWCARFSPDGRRVVTSGFDNTARIWSSANGRLLLTLKHEGEVIYAEFSHDGRRMATASFDKTARVWSSTDGRLLTTLSGHSDEVTHAEFSPDDQSILTASYDHTARVWNVADGRSLVILQGHTDQVWHAVFSPDGHFIVTASWDHTARVWNAADGRLLFVLPHDGPVYHAAVSVDGRRVITASHDRAARVWNAADGRLLATLQGSADAVYDAEFSSSGGQIVTGSGDGTVRLWNTSAGRSLAVLHGHTAIVGFGAFSPDGQRIVTASWDHTARVWSAADGHLLATLQGHTDQVYNARFSPDGQRIVTPSSDHTARVWNAADGRLLATLQGHTDRIWGAQFSPDGQRIITASSDHTARVWNAADGRVMLTLQGHTDQVYQAVFSPDGRLIVTASWDHTARVWNAADGRFLATLQGHTDQVWNAQFSPDSQRVVTASRDHTARIWRAADGALLLAFQGHTDSVVRAQFSPDGQYIVTASFDQTARVWNAADGRLLLTLLGHTEPLTGVQFSPDGQRIVTTSSDQTARVWNAADGRLLATLQGHSSEVRSAQFSPDGQRIVTASADQTARVWQVITLDDISRILAK